jgi:hypothetical protein
MYKQKLEDERIDAGVAVDLFLPACANANNPVDPVDLIRCLFWPQKYVRRTTAFSARMAAALLAEAAGLCSILRVDGTDRVYMHPTTCRVMCETLKTKAPYVPLVEDLCKALEELPAAPGHPESGKLYEKVMTLALVCRLATCYKKSIRLGDLFPTHGEGTIFDASIAAGYCLDERQIECFPRAAELLKTGGWRNVECPVMPKTGLQQADPDYFSIFSDRYALVFDSLMSIRTPAAAPAAPAFKPSVTIGLQFNELKDPQWEDLISNAKEQGKRHLGWENERTKNNVSAFLGVHDLISVIVSPVSPQQDLQGLKGLLTPMQVDVNGQEHVVHFAVLHRDDVLTWCPMVAYSGCDTHALPPLT